MNAVEIIAEIAHLPPGEQARVVSFVRTLEAGRPWAAPELTAAATALVAESDPSEAQTLKERIVEGFYGRGHGA